MIASVFVDIYRAPVVVGAIVKGNKYLDASI